MKLRILNDTALRTLKSGIATNIDKYSAVDHGWLDEFFAEKSNTFESRIIQRDVEIRVPNGEDRKECDYFNAVTLHKSYPEISAAQAVDERLWATLGHRQYFEYMQARWPAVVTQKGQTKEGIVEQHYFFYRGPRKSQERNGIARLWLSAELTHDDQRENPYELTDVILRNTNFVFYLFGHGYGSNKKIVQGSLDAMLRIERETHSSVTRTPLKEYARRLNLLGGASAIDVLSKEDIERDAYDFMKYMMNNE